MRALLAALLCCLPLLALAAEPEVRVQNRLVPKDATLVGGSINMEVDLLVDTWFTAAPLLPKLDLPGAVVTLPSGEAQHLTEQQDGKTFFGLRFVYQITPQVAQRFDIAALQFQVQPGQASGPLTVSSQPLSFVAKPVADADATTQRLVARSVTLVQDLRRSHDPLRVGDSITRHLRIEAEGAQAMLIPPPQLAEVEGLKRYVQTPKVAPLSDGRGGTAGGAREDAVTYVIGAAGGHSLPAIELQWWDATTGEAHRVSVPAVKVEAVEGAYRAPFSISDDLRALGQKAQVRVSGHWLLVSALLLLAVALAFFGRPWARVALARLRRWRAAQHQAWLDSADYAWKLAQQQSRVRPAQLGGLYLWVRRRTGNLTISSLYPAFSGASANRLLAFFGARYAQRWPGDSASSDLTQVLPELRQVVTEWHKTSRARRHGLRPLNP